MNEMDYKVYVEAFNRRDYGKLETFFALPIFDSHHQNLATVRSVLSFYTLLHIRNRRLFDRRPQVIRLELLKQITTRGFTESLANLANIAFICRSWRTTGPKASVIQPVNNFTIVEPLCLASLVQGRRKDAVLHIISRRCFF